MMIFLIILAIFMLGDLCCRMDAILASRRNEYNIVVIRQGRDDEEDNEESLTYGRNRLKP